MKETDQGAPGIEPLVLHAFVIPAQAGLDPIRVMLQDLGPGEGRIIIGCYGNAWECYWGAMGTERIREFVADAEASYVANVLSHGRCTSRFEHEYLERVVKAVQAALRMPAAAGGVECLYDGPYGTLRAPLVVHGTIPECVCPKCSAAVAMPDPEDEAFEDELRLAVAAALGTHTVQRDVPSPFKKGAWPEDQRGVLITDANGRHHFSGLMEGGSSFETHDPDFAFIPNYPGDLNAIAAAEKGVLKFFSSRDRWCRELQLIVTRDRGSVDILALSECLRASALQRTEALVRVIRAKGSGQ